MDKLEPLIRHRFWILFVISLPLAVAGYFLSNSEMQAATETREGQLESALNGVPAGTTEPNEHYARGLKVINDRLQEENNVEIQKLWEAQRERMTWPEIMHRYLPNVHRGEIDRGGLRQYVKEYPGIIRRLWERVQPVVSDPRPLGLTVDWPELVVLMPETLPIAQFHEHQQITSREMWDAQEDVWLMELLFDAVVRTNDGATYIGDAPVRAIDELYLTGGNGDYAAFIKGEDPNAQGGGGGGKGKDREAGDFQSWDDFDAATSGAEPTSTPGATSGQGVRPPAEGQFEIAEEIGPQVPDPELESQLAASPTAETNPLAALRNISLGQGKNERELRGPRGTESGEGRMANTPPGTPGMFRYIGKPEEVEKQPYHERAFYMSAVVMLSDLPNLLTELASSEWPIRIGRFHVSPNPYADLDSGSKGRNQNRRSRRTPGLLGNRRDNDDDGGGGLFSGLRGSPTLYGSVPGSGLQGGRSGPYAIPPTIAGPTEIDPNWFSDPELVQVDFYGVITLYKPITNAAITKKSDGTSEEESLQDIEAAEAATKAAEESADQPSETSEEPIDQSSTNEATEDSEAAFGESDSGDEPPAAEPEEAASDDDSFTFGSPAEPADEGIPEDEAAPDQ